MELSNSFNMTKKRIRTQEYLPPLDIKDGVILTEGRYIKILEVLPVNFRMRDPEEQQKILVSYKELLSVGPVNFSIKAITRKSGISEYVKRLNEILQEETVESRKELIRDHINFTQRESQLNGIEHHLYFIFEYEAGAFFRKKSEEEIIYSLNAQAQNIATRFSSLGNYVIKHDDEDFFLAEFIYNYYNKRIMGTHPFMSRVRRMEQDYEKVDEITENRAPQVLEMRDLLAPHSVDATHPNYLIVDGLYYMFTAISSKSYPQTTGPTSWLSQLMNARWGVDVDVFYQKQNREDMFNKIKLRTKVTNMQASELSSQQSNFEEIMAKKAALQELRDLIKNSKEDIYYTHTFITLYGYTLDDVYNTRRALEDLATTYDMQLIDFRHQQDEVFYSLAPFNRLDSRLAKMTYHNLTQSAVAASYPFSSFALQDEGGILLGVNEENNSLVIYNNFDEKKYSNRNITIFGESGRGKTYTLLTITTRFSLLGVQTFIIAPDKQDEFRRVCTALDGTFVDAAPGSNSTINPLDIFPIVSEADSAIYEGKSEASWLANKIDNLEIWIKFIFPDIERNDIAVLKNAAKRAYARKGITSDNDTIFTDDTRTQKVEMPTLSDLYREILADKNHSKDLEIILSEYVAGGAHGNLDGQTNIDLTKKYIVFGTENLKGTIQSATMFLILEFIWAVTRSDKTKRKIIALDEGWKLLDPKNPQVGEFVLEIFKVIRGYGGAALFATQNLSDLFRAENGNLGEGIINSASANILLGTKKKEHELIQKTLDISYNEVAKLMTKDRGHAILCAGHNHINLAVHASQMENRLFTTSQEELRKLAMEKMKGE